MTASRFRTRPVEVEAIRWTGDNCAEVHAFLGERHWDWCTHSCFTLYPHGVEVYTGVGDWIVNGPDGFEVWPDHALPTRYEPVEAGES